MNASAVERYPLALRVLHWLLAVLLMLQFGLGLAAEHAVPPAIAGRLLAVHFPLGIVILCLMTLRLVLRLTLHAPAVQRDEPRWRQRVRSGVHAALYVLVLLLPISGHVIWVWMGADRHLPGGWEVPAFFMPPEDETGRALAWYVHVYGAWLLLALMVLHVAAAFHRQWTRGDGFIARRMGWGSQPPRRPCTAKRRS